MRLRSAIDGSVEPRPTRARRGVRPRRVVVIATLVVGTAILGGTLAAPQGSALFYALGLVAAVTWIVGAALSGPIPARRPSRATSRRVDVVVAVVIGVALFGAFLAAKLLADSLPLFSGSVASVLATADAGPRVSVLALALVNGVGEELFFRGSLQSSFTEHAAGWTVAIYCVVTLASLNVALVAAALVMGAVFSAQRRATGGVLASLVTHLTWSTFMLLLLPR